MANNKELTQQFENAAKDYAELANLNKPRKDKEKFTVDDIRDAYLAACEWMTETFQISIKGSDNNDD